MIRFGVRCIAVSLACAGLSFGAVAQTKMNAVVPSQQLPLESASDVPDLVRVNQDGQALGEADFVYSSDLMAAGAEPFPVSASANATYGLRQGTDLYLCFIADTSDNQEIRQNILLAELNGSGTSRTLPNIPVICVLTQ